MAFLRALVFGLLVLALTPLAFVAACAALLLDPRRGRLGHAVSRLWGRMVLSAAGAELALEGAEHLRPDEPRVLMPTHGSYLDIPALLAAFDGQMRFVARHTLLWLPFVGWYIALGGHFAIVRNDPRQAMALMERIARRMRRDALSPLLFPEGTRSPNGRLGDLRTGAFQLPLAVNVPVQPMAILGAREILPKGAWFPRRGGRLLVRVGPAIPPPTATGSGARKEFAEATRLALEALLAAGR